MRGLKRFALLAILVTLRAGAVNIPTKAVGFNGDEPVVRESVLAHRDFPFLMKLLSAEAVRTELEHDPGFRAMTEARWAAVQAATAHCGAAAACYGKALLFTPQQVTEASQALRRIYDSNPAMRTFVAAQLKPAREFSLTPSSDGGDLLVDNWVRSAAAIDLILDRYCEAQAPRYSVDVGFYPEDSLRYGRMMQVIAEGLAVPGPEWAGSRGQSALFFEPSLRFSIRVLEANSLDQAGRFWPLRSGANAQVVSRLGTIQWSRYPYSVIVVPGAGPQLPDVALSPWGKERLRLAAAAYRSGKAPLLLVSGGFVHPVHTRFCEAIEMKRYLVHALGIPATAILVDPYARHTTTNLRNAVREIIHYGLPMGRPMLVISDADQVAYIRSPRFATRCQQELGYQPVTLGKSLSPTRLEVLPSARSLFRDPQDPLDP